MQKTVCYRNWQFQTVNYLQRLEILVCWGHFQDRRVYTQTPEVSVAMTTALRLPVAMFWTKRISSMVWVQAYIEDSVLCKDSMVDKQYYLYISSFSLWKTRKHSPTCYSACAKSILTSGAINLRLMCSVWIY